MRFIDRVRIQVRAGDGGDGAVAWRREAHVPKGGPAGGDGGDGGDVVLVADAQLATLLDLKYRQHHHAPSGRPGGGAGKNGRGGETLEVHVPLGTAVYYEGEATGHGERPPWLDDETPDETPEGISVEPDGEGMDNVWIVDGEEVEAPGQAGEPAEAEADPERVELIELGAPAEVVAIGETISGGAQRRHMRRGTGRSRRREEPRSYERGDLICDLDADGERLTIARGGRGGRGNVHFRSSTNRAPDRAEAGTEGEGMWLRLELKLLADVGIVGYPNVGKSTLISAISRARPEIGAYPFTTLVPQLGVVSLPGDTYERTMVVADVPGLVDGASEGRGLGHEFLRHLERTRVLLHLLAPDPTPGRELLRDLDALEGELRRYGPMFEGRPRVVALNKIDTTEGQELIKATRRALRKRNIPLFPISAVTGEGTDALLEALWRRLQLADRARGT
ncbi:GTPase Obg [Enhygromyxa salina]|uniref:GTPase Obg n=1 Tax=Enhygromyxa salina TaxID=215803 RepID=A0A2S9XEP4_9BACT|nr:GTPase Obg [Enhygromyxa salina]PRP91334.1 GTPase Obg [Enhygromyxa salina]